MRKLIWTSSGGHCGGYADRLKGIVTAYLLAKQCDREFFIEWNDLTNLQDCFDVSCAFEGPREQGAGTVGLIDHLETEHEIVFQRDFLRGMAEETIYVSVNQYDEPHWRVLGDVREFVSETFSRVLNSLLTPKPSVTSPLVGAMSLMQHNRVGVQVRTGEQNYPHEHGLKRIEPAEVWERVLQHSRPGSVFVASDSPKWKQDFADVNPNLSTFQLCFTPAHIERSEPEEIRRTFMMTVIEHQILSRCSKVYTGWGGFGRTAAWWGQKPCIDLLTATLANAGGRA